jgi:hypothetical protein
MLFPKPWAPAASAGAFLVFYNDGAFDLPMTEPAEVVAPIVESTHLVGHQPNPSDLARENVSANAEAWDIEPMNNVKGRQLEDDGNTALEHDLRCRELETLCLDLDRGFGLLCHQVGRSAQYGEKSDQRSGRKQQDLPSSEGHGWPRCKDHATGPGQSQELSAINVCSHTQLSV